MIRRLADFWISRNAAPIEEALTSVSDMRPMTVVTGGSRGIGLALARRFAKAGHNVTLIARHPNDLAEAAAEIARTRRTVVVLTIAIDITEPGAVERIEAHLTTSGFYIHTLVNCAGIGLAGPFVDHTPAAIDDLLSLNIAALTRFTRHALPAMLARGEGGIINIASLGGLIPGPNQAAYYASKAYVISLSRAVASEISGRGVRMMALAPGPVDTSFHRAMGAEMSFYRQLLFSLSARQVAFEAYLAYMWGFRLYVPGLSAKLLQIAVWIIPHALLIPVIGWLLRRREERLWSDTDDKKA